MSSLWLGILPSGLSVTVGNMINWRSTDDSGHDSYVASVGCRVDSLAVRSSTRGLYGMSNRCIFLQCHTMIQKAELQLSLDETV
jgi:plastocyanin